MEREGHCWYIYERESDCTKVVDVLLSSERIVCGLGHQTDIRLDLLGHRSL